MGFIRENDCVGCETCMGCGRDRDYFILECDCCEEVINFNNEVFYETAKYRYVCEDCYIEYLKENGNITEDEEGISCFGIQFDDEYDMRDWLRENGDVVDE